MAKAPPQPVSTQAHLPLAGVVEGVVIMRDGSYRAVLSVGSTNFMLKSEAEQNALIGAYQNFLNSLNYPIQVVMQSRHLDLETYLKKLEARIIEQQNELIRQQTTDYVAYVRELISVANIMDKHFYAVVSYTPVTAAKRSLVAGLFPQSIPASVSIDETQFKTHREELMQRAVIIGNALSGLGLHAQVLDTDDVVKLLYSVYNYEIASAEHLEKPTELSEGVISTEAPETGQEQPLLQETPPAPVQEPVQTTEAQAAPETVTQPAEAPVPAPEEPQEPVGGQ